jgi:hypothetical protein
VTLTRRVVRQAGKVRRRWQQGKLPVVGSWSSLPMQMVRFEHFVHSVAKVIQQTQQRVFGGKRAWTGKS